MAPFKNPEASHEHSLKILNLLYEYDSFLDSIETVADFGSGAGLDTLWWATLTTRDEPPEPRNYLTYAVDKNIKHLNKDLVALPNVKAIEADLDCADVLIPRQVDFIWCHDVFQYITNPLSTLRTWNHQLHVDGMLMLVFPQYQYYSYNKINYESRSLCFYNHNIVNLMYMLAVNGFDCKDAYFKKDDNDPWIYAAVYKSDIEPMDPKVTTWETLIENNLVNDSVNLCLQKYGYIKQDNLLTKWLDKGLYRLKE